MLYDAGKKMLPARISGTGAAPNMVLTYKPGKGWHPAAPAASGLAIVSTTAPSSPPTGQLWYDPSATC